MEASFARGTILILNAANETDPVEANMSQEAVIILPASQHTVATKALLVPGTVGVRTALWHADFFLTAVARWAVGVILAGRWHADALKHRVASEAICACALLFVVLHPAFSVDSAGSVAVT